MTKLLEIPHANNTVCDAISWLYNDSQAYCHKISCLQRVRLADNLIVNIHCNVHNVNGDTFNV